MQKIYIYWVYHILIPQNKTHNVYDYYYYLYIINMENNPVEKDIFTNYQEWSCALMTL